MPSKAKPIVQAKISKSKIKLASTASAYMPPKVQKSRKLAQVTGAARTTVTPPG